MDATQTQPQATNGAIAKAASSATIEIIPKTGEIVRVGYDTFQGFLALQRVAGMFSASTIVPEAYRGSIANCAIAVNMAIRLGADPLLVMQHLYLVHGKPGWSAQFMIAAFNQCGRFATIRYRFTGKKGADDWTCQAYSRELSTNEPIDGPEVSVQMAKDEGWHAKNPKWRTMTQLMLTYRAASFLVKTTAPEIAMGLQTKEELEDVEGADNTSTFTAPPSPAALPVAGSNPAPAAGAGTEPAGCGPQAGSLPPSGNPSASPEETASTLAAAQEQLRLAAEQGA